MPERNVSPEIYGIETEYSCMVSLPGNVIHEIVGQCHSIDAKLGLYQEPPTRGTSVISEGMLDQALASLGIIRNSDGMLSNGGRLYFDPSGPEYDTPETTTAEEAVHRCFDGDEILLGVFKHLRDQGHIEGFQINRRIVDHNRSSRGVHLNTTTSMNKREPSELVTNWLATLNVAKGAIFGSGGLLIDSSGDTAFHHSPRLSLTAKLSANYGNYKERPLVRQPFKEDGAHLSRIETVTSDALGFAWPLRASLIATNALTGVIELGYGNRLPRLDRPVLAAGVVGRYGYAKNITVFGRNDKSITISPLDLLLEICETVLDTDDIEGHLDRESDQVIGEIAETAERMKADRLSVASQVESIARAQAIAKKKAKHDIALDSERMCRFDYAWDWIGGGGIAETLRHRNKAGWHGFSAGHSVIAQRRRMVNPPSDTRASIRGEMIRLGEGNAVLDWNKIVVDGLQEYIHPLDALSSGR